MTIVFRKFVYCKLGKRYNYVAMLKSMLNKVVRHIRLSSFAPALLADNQQ